MKNTMHALAICGILSGSVFANGLASLETPLASESTVNMKEQQTSQKKENKNTNIALGVGLSAFRGFLVGSAVLWPYSGVGWTKGIRAIAKGAKDKGVSKVLGIYGGLILASIGIDHILGAYQEKILHPRSDEDRTSSLKVGTIGAALNTAVPAFIWAFSSSIGFEMGVGVTVIGLVLGSIFGSIANGIYQGFEFAHFKYATRNTFAKTHETQGEKTTTQA